MTGRAAKGRRVTLAFWTTLVLATTVMSSCFGRTDYQLYVRSTSDREWMVRTSRGWSDGSLIVNRVRPGADGISVSWAGRRDAQIELLDLDCTVVGSFVLSDDGSYEVPGVSGLRGWIEPWTTHVEKLTTPEISATAECGGFMPL